MPTPPKRKKTKAAKTRGTAIDSAQRDLLERQNKLQAEIDALQRSIEAEQAARPASGPRRAAVPHGQYIHGATTMTDLRRATAANMEAVRRKGPRRPPMLREERAAARRQAMALIVVLAAAVIYALSHVPAVSFALSRLLP